MLSPLSPFMNVRIVQNTFSLQSTHYGAVCLTEIDSYVSDDNRPFFCDFLMENGPRGQLSC